MAPTSRSVATAASTAAGFGGSIDPARNPSALAPTRSFLICRTISVSGTRCISGTWWLRIFSSWRWEVYSAKHFPGLTRPARPARCLAAARDTHPSSRLAIPRRGSHWRSFTRPVSTTTTTSGIVTDVSATLVATTILRTPRGGTLNASRCSAGVHRECRGTILCVPRLGANDGCEPRRSHKLVTSPTPGRKTRKAPDPSDSSACTSSRSTRS